MSTSTRLCSDLGGLYVGRGSDWDDREGEFEGDGLDELDGEFTGEDQDMKGMGELQGGA